MKKEILLIDNKEMHYSFHKGNENLLLIKGGDGGSLFGYKDKYKKVAKQFIELGYSVLICNNPSELDTFVSFDETIKLCKALMPDKFNIYYFGFSRGAYQGILYGNEHKEFKKMLLVNSPLMVNFHKQIDGIKSINKPSTIIIGELDTSSKFIDWIKQIDNKNVKIIELNNIDHNFTNYLEDFINLPKKYLL